MKAGVIRITALGMFFLFAGAGAAAAGVVVEEDDEAKLECADHISSGELDDPLTGHLIGTQTVREQTTTGTGTSASVGGGAVPASAGASTTDSKTVTIEYEVGYYSMSDKRQLKIDCRTYTVVK